MKTRMESGVDAPYVNLIGHHMKTCVILESGSLDHQLACGHRYSYVPDATWWILAPWLDMSGGPLLEFMSCEDVRSITFVGDQALPELSGIICCHAGRLL